MVGRSNLLVIMVLQAGMEKKVGIISSATISANSITTDIVAVHEMLEYFLIEKNLVLAD